MVAVERCRCRAVIGSAFAAVALVGLPVHAHFSEVVAKKDANVQDAKCQSYALAVALAWHRDRAFDLEHVVNLQETTRSISTEAKITTVRRTIGRDELDRVDAQSHQNLAAAVSRVTQGAYELTSADVEPSNVLASIGRARPTMFSRGRVLPLGEGIPEPVLIATRRIDGRRMSFGSLVPVFGVRYAPAGADPKSIELLTLSAGLTSKVDSQPVFTLDCSGGAARDSLPSEYVVRLAWVPETWFNWRHYAGCVRIFRVEKKGRRGH